MACWIQSHEVVADRAKMIAEEMKRFMAGVVEWFMADGFFMVRCVNDVIPMVAEVVSIS